jgi:sphinganine C4-monooxygenase
MHMNKFLYKHFHSVHHRLHVPYAFGALYNHPVEGFFLDSMGAVIAESLSGMTTRQAMLLFSISTCKTVDDHCGYRLPFDPLQLFSQNNADYHDIHHQVNLSRRLSNFPVLNTSNRRSALNTTIPNHFSSTGMFFWVLD